MKYVRPDYYDSFRCIADRCTHSCCVDWEIEIDYETTEYYSRIEGEIGDKLRRCMAHEPETHFILDERKRCPFLKENGLCELILTLGEDSLCEICAEHPRFYNEFSGRTEYGVGMCCEAAAELLLTGDRPVIYIYEEDEAEPEEEREIFELRDKILQELASGEDFYHCISSAARLAGSSLPRIDIQGWIETLLRLERLDKAWTEKLESLKRFVWQEQEPALNDYRYRRIADYFLFRYFASAEEQQRGAVVRFAFFAAVIICALDLCCGRDSEHLRLFSSEIEYSDENVGLLLDFLA